MSVKPEKIQQALKNITLYFDEPLANYTFTKTGGPADVLVFPKTSAEVETVVEYCQTAGYPWQVLGNASNLIVRDGGIAGFVLMLTEMNTLKVTGEHLQADAGARLIDASQLALTHSLTGFEFACGIPGSVGGAVYMNAGAYGGEIKDILVSAKILWADGSLEEVEAHDLAFSYRHSRLQTETGIVLQATFALASGEQATIASKMQELTDLREAKQPLEYPSCGSVFKRPAGHFTGQLIQEAGLQGLTWGGAQISEKHAGFIVNINHATATDYVELIAHIQDVIQAKFQVTLETEVRIIGREERKP